MRFSEISDGQVLAFGSYHVTDKEIIDFASKYDPQPFHVDVDAARASRWGGLIASGFHTCSIAMHMVVQHVLLDSESYGSPGLSSVSWPRPVRPGDTLRMRIQVLAVSSRGRGTGIVRWSWQMLNQRDEAVLDLVATSLFAIPSNSQAKPNVTN